MPAKSVRPVLTWTFRPLFGRGNVDRWMANDRDPPFTRRSSGDQNRVMRTLTLGLLHLAPGRGELTSNRRLIEDATRAAAAAGCDWVVSGELVATGYDFVPVLGTDWIEPLPDEWLISYATLAAELGVAAFVDVPSRDPGTDTLHSTLIAIDRSGAVVGDHHKIAVIPGVESWASSGTTAEPVMVDGLRVGLLVCADAHPPGIADRHAEQGVDLFVSAAAWTPGHHGPDGEWESISVRTGRPVVVVNRGGVDDHRDFSDAVSTVVVGGERVVEVASAESAVFIVELSWTTDGVVSATLRSALQIDRIAD